LVQKPEGRRLLEDLRHRWEDNVKMDVKETVCKGIIGLIWLSIGTSARLFNGLFKLKHLGKCIPGDNTIYVCLL